MNCNLKVSLLIPTYNASSIWKNVLEGISTQTFILHKKIIIDSGSTDQTVTLALENGFEVHHIQKHEFNHGKTRQKLVDLAGDADICVFLTQDAILASIYSVKNMVAVFDDPNVGISYGRQLPHKNAKVLESHARLYNYPPYSQFQVFADRDRLGFKSFFCSNSFAAYRKSVLMAVGGFPTESIMGEDAIVAAKILMTGVKKAYVADATVYHSHNYTLAEEFRRYFDTRIFHEQNPWLKEQFGHPAGEGFKFVKSQLKYVIRHDFKFIFMSITSIGTKWLGYKIGKYYKRIPRNILKKLSMHKNYW